MLVAGVVTEPIPRPMVHKPTITHIVLPAESTPSRHATPTAVTRRPPTITRRSPPGARRS
jgi:hypothetical protein